MLNVDAFLFCFFLCEFCSIEIVCGVKPMATGNFRIVGVQWARKRICTSAACRWKTTEENKCVKRTRLTILFILNVSAREIIVVNVFRIFENEIRNTIHFQFVFFFVLPFNAECIIINPKIDYFIIIWSSYICMGWFSRSTVGYHLPHLAIKSESCVFENSHRHRWRYSMHGARHTAK